MAVPVGPGFRVVVLPDVHADIEKAQEALRHARVVDASGSWACRRTVLVQLGDQVDGGSRGGDASPFEARGHTHGRATQRDLATLAYFSRLAREASSAGDGSACISLAGNNELMNIVGDFTYSDLQGCPECHRHRATMLAAGSDGAREIGLTRLCAAKVGPYLFGHAGFSSTHGDPFRYNDTLYRVCMSRTPVRSDIEALLGPEGVLTHRKFHPQNLTPQAIQDVQSVLRATRSRKMIIGHNTVPGAAAKAGPDECLIVMDPGVSRAVSNATPAALILYPDKRGAQEVQILRTKP